jgi:putative ABC transport system permease protein
MGAREVVTSTLADVTVARRSLRRSPGFVVASVLSLGLAIGAGVAGFGVLDAVRFRALPFPHADRLVLISEVPTAGCPNVCDVNDKTLAILREHHFKSIDALAAFTAGAKAIGSGADQVDVIAGIVSAATFDMLGVKPVIGRTFAPDEDRIGAVPTMLMGHNLWKNTFGGDPSILGKTYSLSDEPFTVIGVMPAGFTFESRSQAWLAASRYLDPRTGTSLRSINVLARLAPGATSEQLAGELRTLEAAANDGRPERNRTTFGVSPLRDRYVGATRSRDLAFAAIVGAILAIGCANVASLVLVRATRHRRELAIRGALGASNRDLVRYLFVENILLSMAGLVLGLALAVIALRTLQSVAPLQAGIRVPGMEYRIDGRVVLFAVLLTSVVACLLSLAPVQILLRTDLQRTLREGSLTATISRGGNRTQQAFVVVQTACAVALLVATGLMVKTIVRFAGVELGYDADHVAYVSIVPAHSGRRQEKYLPVADRILLQLAALPGVEASALRMSVPFAAARPRAAGVIVVRRDLDEATMTLDGGKAVPRELQPRNAFGVSPDYFSVMNIPMVAGRAFTQSDGPSSPGVAVINEWAARRWWPNENAVGRTFSVDTAPGARAMITVVGVVKDNLAAQASILVARLGPEVYRPFTQANYWIATYYVRTHASVGRIIEQAKDEVMRLVPANGRAQGGVVSAQLASQRQSVRTNATQVAGFALVGLLLAITGLYGLLSYVVQQRTHEIGVRGVLGAGRGQILGMVLSQAMRLTLTGILVGLVTAILGTRLMAGLLYGTPTNDPIVYAAVSAVAFAVALVASYFPALRASRVDPAIALRAS